MTPINNLSVLPFYKSLNDQFHRKWYSFGEHYPLITPSGRVLPFQIAVGSGEAVGIEVHIHDINQSRSERSTQIENALIITSYPQEDLMLVTYTDPAIITYLNNKEGRFYLSIRMNNVWYYSEVFHLTKNIDKHLQLVWYSNESLYYVGGHIQYQFPGNVLYKHTAYIASELGRPEYIYEEEGEDRDGFFFPEKITSEKRFKFVFAAPEYLLDAMRTIRLSDNIQIKVEGNVYKCDTFLLSPSWSDRGDLATVEAEFETDTVIKRIGMIK